MFISEQYKEFCFADIPWKKKHIMIVIEVNFDVLQKEKS
jgi:hypothetical protein